MVIAKRRGALLLSKGKKKKRGREEKKKGGGDIGARRRDQKGRGPSFRKKNIVGGGGVAVRDAATRKLKRSTKKGGKKFSPILGSVSEKRGCIFGRNCHAHPASARRSLEGKGQGHRKSKPDAAKRRGEGIRAVRVNASGGEGGDSIRFAWGKKPSVPRD